MLQHHELQVLEGMNFLKLPERLLSFESLYFEDRQQLTAVNVKIWITSPEMGGEPGFSSEEWVPACLFIEHKCVLYQKVKRR